MWGDLVLVTIGLLTLAACLVGFNMRIHLAFLEYWFFHDL